VGWDRVCDGEEEREGRVQVGSGLYHSGLEWELGWGVRGWILLLDIL
jgi:hypothetical protein